MSEYAFIRIEAYARVAPHKKNSRERKQSIDGVFGEMMRRPDCCPHVPDPKEPQVLYGDPRTVLKEAMEQAASALEKREKRLRTTGLALVAGVISYPVPRAHVERDAQERARCDRWLAKSQAWLHQKFGDRFKLLVAHWDEPYVNAHFVCLPSLGPDRRLRIGDVHPGHRAAQACDDAGGSKRKQKKAHQEAMTQFVDEFYQGVVIEFGFARFGRKRQRLDRDGWKAQTKQLRALADSQEKLRHLQQGLKSAAEKTLAAAIAEAEDRAARLVAEMEAAANRKIDKMKQQAIARLGQLDAENRRLKGEAQRWQKIAVEQEELVHELKDVIAQLGVGQTFKS